MPNILESARIAKKCSPDGGVIQVNHPGKDIHAGVSAYDFFRSAKCPHAFISTVLRKDGQWNGRYRYPSDIFSLPVENLDAKLNEAFFAIYSLANGSLDSIYKHGFNKHDPVHIQRVKDSLTHLLKLAGASEEVMKRGLIAAAGHDTGNPWSRELHSLVSPRVVARVLPAVLREDRRKDWRVIRRAIELHNEPIAAWLITSWEREVGHPLTEGEIIARMRTDFGSEALALIIADKTDVGRHRISEKPKDAAAVDEDQHLEVNLLGKTESLVLTEQGDVFVWNMQFTPGLAEDEEQLFVHQSKNHGKRVRVSQETHRRHKEEGISHFDTWKGLFWTLYADRVFLAIRSAFALYPNLKRFVIRVVDTDDTRKGTEVYEQHFTFANLRDEIDAIRVKRQLGLPHRE